MAQRGFAWAALVILGTGALGVIGCGSSDSGGAAPAPTGKGGAAGSSTGGAGGAAKGGASAGGDGGAGGEGGGTAAGGNGTGGSAGSGGSGAGLDDGAAAVAAAYCAKAMECSPAFFLTIYPDQATCVAHSKAATLLTYDVEGTNETTADLKACADAMSKASCDTGYAFVDACVARPGAHPTGDPCYAGAQCQSTLCQTDATGCGHCVDPIPTGQPCTAAGPSCARGSYCSSKQTTCVPARKVGESCTMNGDDSMACNPLESVCVQGTCKLPVQVGASCMPGGDVCDYLNHNLACDAATHQCVVVATVAVGQTCGVVQKALVACQAGSTCNATGMSQGTCVAVADVGQACTMLNAGGDNCYFPYHCIGGVCAERATPMCM